MTLHQRELIRLFDHHVRRQCRCGDRKMDRLEVTGLTSTPYENIVLWSQLDASNADHILDAQVRYYEKLQHDFIWFVYGYDQPTDLTQRLQARDFQVDSEEKVVVAKSSMFDVCQPPDDILIRRLLDPEDIPDSLAVSDAVWGKRNSAFVSRWLKDLVCDYPEESMVVVAYHHDKPVGTAWATYGDFKHEMHFASLFGGTVLPEWRGKGIYSSMVAMRAKDALEHGVEWCVVDAGPESFPILEKLGFTTLTKRITLRRNCR